MRCFPDMSSSELKLMEVTVAWMTVGSVQGWGRNTSAVRCQTVTSIQNEGIS